MEERHVDISMRLQETALEALSTLSLSKMSAADIMRFMVESIKLEKLVRGEVTPRNEISATNGGPIPKAVTVKELEEKVSKLIDQGCLAVQESS